MPLRLPLAFTLLVLLATGCPNAPSPDGEGEGEGAHEGEGSDGEGGPPPTVVCPPPLDLVDVSDATVVGDGTAGSCNEATLASALASSPAKVRFDCGAAPVTITLSATIHVTTDLVLDGAGVVTLSGGNAARILSIDSSFEKSTPHVVVQNLTFSDGVASGTDLGGGGAAITRLGGALDVIDCNFVHNIGNVDGQDTQGGAVFSEGGTATTIVGSTFTNNSCSDGGALGTLNSNLVVVNATFDGNSATGTGGNPGDGGNGGSIYMDAQDRDMTLCGVSISNSHANAFGGGVFRMAYSQTEKTNIASTTIENATIDDHDPSMAGGLYLQATVATLDAVTILDSSARTAGGAYFGPGASIALTNVSFLDDTALSGLGGAAFISGVTGGSITNCTFAGNKAPGDVAFAGAITGDASNVTMTNTLILDSEAGNGFNPISCTTTLEDGSGSFQFPIVRSGGGSDDPDALCAPNVAKVDVPLGDVDASGVVPVRAPKTGAPAFGAGHGCPSTDALGKPRGDPCTAGAVE